MKKLLILMLVLGLASTANALLSEIYISVDGANDVTAKTMAVCETAVFDVEVLALEQGVGYLLIITDDVPYGEWYDGLGSYTASKWENGGGAGDGYPANFAGRGDFPGTIDRFEHVSYGVGYEFDIAGAAENPQLPGGKAYELLFHCEAVGEVVIVALDGDGTEKDRVTITQIPEPITIALLGLGGLLLRRRKGG